MEEIQGKIDSVFSGKSSGFIGTGKDAARFRIVAHDPDVKNVRIQIVRDGEAYKAWRVLHQKAGDYELQDELTVWYQKSYNRYRDWMDEVVADFWVGYDFFKYNDIQW